MDIADPFADLSSWQAMLERNHEVLGSLLPGAAIGLLANGERQTAATFLDSDILVWSAAKGGMQALTRPFVSFQKSGVDLLLVLDDEALDNLIESIDGDPFPKLSQDSAKGAVLIYYLKARDDLVDLGYEGFFDTVGLSFAGTCR